MDPSVLDPQHQADNDAFASAVGAAAHQLGLDTEHDGHGEHGHGGHSDHGDLGPHGPHDASHSHSLDDPTNHFHHQLQQPDFSTHTHSHTPHQSSPDSHAHAHAHSHALSDLGVGVGIGVGVGVGADLDLGLGHSHSHSHSHPHSHGHSPTIDEVNVANLDLPLGSGAQDSHAHSHVNVHSVSVPHSQAQSTHGTPLPHHSHEHTPDHHQLEREDFLKYLIPDPDETGAGPGVGVGVGVGAGTGAGMGEPETSPEPQHSTFTRPPSIRKACDLCHAAKQKCSGDRPTCTRCAVGGWQCNYAPRQRRRTVPKEQRQVLIQQQAEETGRQQAAAAKKRKLDARRNSLTFENGLDLKTAMGMAFDMGLGQEDENEDIHTMSTDAMLEVIAVDGYIADLPLATFVANLPYTAPVQDLHVSNDGADDEFGAEAFQAADLDQHTTSALRDAIFSLNESSGHQLGGEEADEGQESVMGEGHDGEGMDPHLALLDLSHIQDGDDGLGGVGVGVGVGVGMGGSGNHNHGVGLGEHDSSDILNLNLGCNHPIMVPHLLHLLTQHSLDPRPHANTPLTMPILAPLSRAIRTFHNITQCPTCCSSPSQTLPQLALISRLATILTFPFPPINSGTLPGAQIVIHGARLSGTGISESIEQHIVNVVWDSWRASIREIFMVFERQAREVISASALVGGPTNDRRDGEGGEGGGDGHGAGTGSPGANGGANGHGHGHGANGSGSGSGVGVGVGVGVGASSAGGGAGAGGGARLTTSSVETQRAGLFFQAMSRLKQAMEEVESE